jgi:hypothetical protein
VHLPVSILPQPDDVTCGPTSLHAVYRYFGEEVQLDEIIDSVDFLEDGGTLAVFLGIDALRRGYQARLYSYNLAVFDPTWSSLDPAALDAKLAAQLEFKADRRLLDSTAAYRQFLALGGEIRFTGLTAELLHKYLDLRLPVLAGLSATYLYGTRREYTGPDNRTLYDDLRGQPAGHFVVLCGIDGQTVYVADPFRENPYSPDHHYAVPLLRLMHAIHLGIVTYDGNLLVIAPVVPA